MNKISRQYAKTPIVKKSNSSLQIQRKKSSQPQKSPADRILFLQRTIGNQAVQRLIKSGTQQARLRIGQPGDKYEQEADRVADAVMRMPEPGVQRQEEPEEEEEMLQAKPLVDQITPLVKRQVEEEEMLQAKSREDATSEVPNDFESQINAIRGGGRPLAESERAYFEPRFGRDFNQVRMHTDTRAAESARVLNARAFTVGQDVVFGAGEFSSGTSTGKRLLAHELTHTIQQYNAKQPFGVQRWSYGTGKAPHADYQVIPAKRKPIIEKGIKLLERVVKNPKKYPVCHRYFKNNCPGGTDSSLANEFNQAVIWFDTDNSVWGSNVAPDNIAYSEGTHRMGRWFVGSVMTHELMHSCGQNNENINDEAILKCGFRDVEILNGKIVEKK